MTSSSLLAASIKYASWSIVRSYPGANLSIPWIRSRLSEPRFVRMKVRIPHIPLYHHRRVYPPQAHQPYTRLAHSGIDRAWFNRTEYLTLLAHNADPYLPGQGAWHAPITSPNLSFGTTRGCSGVHSTKTAWDSAGPRKKIRECCAMWSTWSTTWYIG